MLYVSTIKYRQTSLKVPRNYSYIREEFSRDQNTNKGGLIKLIRNTNDVKKKKTRKIKKVEINAYTRLSCARRRFSGRWLIARGIV